MTATLPDEPERLRKHHLIPSGRWSYGKRMCTCGSLEGDAIHQVRTVTDEEKAFEARRVGERGDQGD